MEKNTANLNGGLLINKPVGMTSFDIIRALRHKGEKWGHSGTLDPFATGLLIILIGRATRLQEELHMLPKTYRAEITLGATSDTDDSTGVIQPRKHREVTRPEIQTALDHIKQETSQIPPNYAAIKINGKKMYEYAREGESVEKKPRPITIHEIILEDYTYPIVKISVTCSTGTYIRSIARDMGDILGTGAYCSQLTRTAIGQFTLEQAFLPENVPIVIHSALIPIEKLISHLPQIIFPDDTVAKYKHGKIGECEQYTPINTPFALLDENKKLFGIGIRETNALVLKPKKIFL